VLLLTRKSARLFFEPKPIFNYRLNVLQMQPYRPN